MAMTATQDNARALENQRVRKLVGRAQSGDRDALEELYLIHFDRIYSYLHVTVGNRHDAEDLTTQTFLKMLEAIGRFRWGSISSAGTPWQRDTTHSGRVGTFYSIQRCRPLPADRLSSFDNCGGVAAWRHVHSLDP